ncbi:hypothetical protein [Candidatus Cardinium hertigii]|jgi:hypothetical protein|uniref:Lipoprotein n=1 Tax=Candidatus Cardinium hertigii TaxID=247481 RepID=A0A3N2QCN6_9BACT|nr:hypothetical protein [Candidatus Cardinium hertigii]ROT47541.1 hypothetical protein EDM02_02145 [Candidatus Cardinium hertigii]
MVYKKITNNISSLSSFLLAGVVFGSSSCPKDGTTTEKLSERPTDTRRSSSVENPRTGEDKKKFGDIFRELILAAQIDHLKHAPMVMEEIDFEGDQTKSNVETLFKSFGTSKAYPPHNENFTALGNTDIFTFKSGASGISGGKLHSKVAYGRAVNEIAKVYQGLHELYKGMEKAAEDGARVPEIEQLLSKCIKFYQDDIKKEGRFVGGRAFQAGKKEVKILPGPNMAKFMNNADRAKGVMEGAIGPVWVKLKVHKDACQALDDAKQACKRGWAIKHSWKVNGEKNIMMPEIAKIDNSTGSANYTANPTAVTVASPGMAAKKTATNLTFGQLFFALFTGVKEKDIFSLEDGNAADKVRFITKDPPFQSLLNKAKESEDAFAEYLGKHIANLPTQAGDENDLFVVPDMEALKDTLIPSSLENSATVMGPNMGGNAYNLATDTLITAVANAVAAGAGNNADNINIIVNAIVTAATGAIEATVRAAYNAVDNEAIKDTVRDAVAAINATHAVVTVRAVENAVEAAVEAVVEATAVRRVVVHAIRAFVYPVVRATDSAAADAAVNDAVNTVFNDAYRAVRAHVVSRITTAIVPADAAVYTVADAVAGAVAGAVVDTLGDTLGDNVITIVNIANAIRTATAAGTSVADGIRAVARKAGSGSVLEDLYKNMVGACGITLGSLPVEQAIEHIEKLDSVSNANANVTFNQRVCAKIARKLGSNPSVKKIAFSKDVEDGKRLCDYIKNVIDSEAEYAIVKKEGSGYKPTSITNKFRDAFNAFVDKLLEKQNDPSVTYDQIRKDSGNTFDIRKVRDAMETDCNAIKSVLESAMRIDDVLAIKEKEIEYKRYFTVSGLSTSNYKHIDNIRLKGVVIEEKKKKEVVKEAVKVPETIKGRS